MKHLIFLSLIISFNSYAQDSSLNTACKKNGYSCGECESDLQNDLNKVLSKITGGGFKEGEHWGNSKEMAANASNIPMAKEATLEGTLQEIISLYKKHNPVGDNKLNFVVIGESESAQGTSVKDGKMYPRIMLKSPNSELMVTFNTDPKAKGYNTLEMMRWNGKQGRYEFQELNFGEKGAKPHVDASGSKCMECHKESPRPNWDTYRAWAGVVPSRDDMLETHSNRSGFEKEKGLQPDARAYIGFLDQMAKDKDAGVKSRIAMLDIPFDDRNQLKDYVQRAGGKKLTAAEQVDMIKQKISRDGYYRVKHFPDKEEAQISRQASKMSFNFDQKTAEWAGPSQFAFDQMLAQNMCKVATDLKNHKDFDKFKYGIAAIAACKQRNTSKLFPEGFQKKVVNYYKDTKYAGLQDIEAGRKPAAEASSFSELENLISEDTAKSHANADGYKFNRHGKFLNSYLTNVEGLSADEAKTQAKHFSEEVFSPQLPSFHAIADQGGVKGVPEDSTAKLTALRLLLEPFGVKVGHWSLVHGKSNAYNSFSFSDQFTQFEDQPLWQEIVDEAGGCQEVEQRARAALQPPESLVAPASPESDNVSEIASLCRMLDSGEAERAVSDMAAIILESSKKDMKQSMRRCLSCHDTDGDVEFPGFADYVKSDKEEEFEKFLLSYSEYFKRPMIDVFKIKLGTMKKPNDGLDYGDDMPPSDWKDNKEFAQKHNIPQRKVQSYRRKYLGEFLNLTAIMKRKENLKEFCEKINNDEAIKESAPSQNNMNGIKASKQ